MRKDRIPYHRTWTQFCLDSGKRPIQDGDEIDYDARREAHRRNAALRKAYRPRSSPWLMRDRDLSVE